MASDLASLLRIAHEAVYRAQIVTRAVQRSLLDDQHISKADDSPVTVADFAAQAVVNRTLHQHLGQQRILAEESAAYLRGDEQQPLLLGVVKAARTSWPEATGEAVLSAIDSGVIDPKTVRRAADLPERYWTLDPIDGTRGFIRGHQYAICLALIERVAGFSRVIVAALGCPNLSLDFDRPFEEPDPHGLTFLATSDSATVQCAADDAPDRAAFTPVKPATIGEGSAARPLRICGSYKASQQSTGAVTRLLDILNRDHITVQPPRRLDSQAKYAVVARGQADAFVRAPREPDHEENVWDHAPGALIAQQAGVRVTDSVGLAMNFTDGTVLVGNRGILAAHPTVHDVLLPAIRRVVG